MGRPVQSLSVIEIVRGGISIRPEMPVWLSKFRDDSWLFRAPTSPLHRGVSSESIVWRDYIEGKGATFGHSNSFSKTTYDYCLSPEIVNDLKVTAVIYGFFPRLITNSKSTRVHIEPATVKGRIEELAKFFSFLIVAGRVRRGIHITRLSQIPFDLLRETITEYPGRGSHLKRALKLISDPIIQNNLSAPLQWGLVDIRSSSLLWPESKIDGGIATLPDSHFLFLLDYCKHSVARFKWMLEMPIHDSDCRDCPPTSGQAERAGLRRAFEAYYWEKSEGRKLQEFKKKYGVSATDIVSIIRDAHASAILIILLFTGMRASETVFLMNGCMTYENGYYFLKSKVVKHRKKEMPISEGWLAIDITRDAYEILSLFCGLTNSPYLFSSAFPGFARDGKGYSLGILNLKLSRWFKTIDVDGVLSGWGFSVHQCRETLVSQLAKQEVGLPFISMQLKHFQSQFNSMPNAATAGYGQYRQQLMKSVSNRIAGARESALLDVYGESATFAGGGAADHKARIDAFFSGLGLFGRGREQYIKAMARRGVKLMPTSIGSCTRNFIAPSEDGPPPCYGDYQCDPNCQSHVITERCSNALIARRQHAMSEANRETRPEFKVVWVGLAERLKAHIDKFQSGGNHG